MLSSPHQTMRGRTLFLSSMYRRSDMITCGVDALEASVVEANVMAGTFLLSKLEWNLKSRAAFFNLVAGSGVRGSTRLQFKIIQKQIDCPSGQLAFFVLQARSRSCVLLSCRGRSTQTKLIGVRYFDICSL
ncbi:hypothetical protein DKX38_014695 [Salix brachista]|uniref:Uncharacterized protein n=1 Tax=Salix brachista TaxID=2182728 RepID=A0A5N5LI32_9ROSI|nr:hypothetical protein DKX38_014695 [Salix brachista]